uniref:Uncharacterized protein n=1 Tax=Jaculus jaculus TaxID=51337 RepID=A0A8C5KSJ2_JACJA
MQLRHIGDSIHHSMVQQRLPRDDGDALARVVALVCRRARLLLRFCRNNHWL